MDTIPEDLLQQAESATSTASEGVDRAVVTVQNPEPAVIETLQGLAKVVSNRHLPRVQGWLKVFVKVSIPVATLTWQSLPYHNAAAHYLLANVLHCSQ